MQAQVLIYFDTVQLEYVQKATIAEAVRLDSVRLKVVWCISLGLCQALPLVSCILTPFYRFPREVDFFQNHFTSLIYSKKVKKLKIRELILRPKIQTESRKNFNPTLRSYALGSLAQSRSSPGTLQKMGSNFTLVWRHTTRFWRSLFFQIESRTFWKVIYILCWQLWYAYFCSESSGKTKSPKI